MNTPNPTTPTTGSPDGSQKVRPPGLPQAGPKKHGKSGEESKPQVPRWVDEDQILAWLENPDNDD